MKKLDVSKQEKEILEDALDFWEQESFIDAEQSRKLRDSLAEKGFDWSILARYAFWIALASLVFAVFSLFIDDSFIQFIATLSEAPNSIFLAFFTVLAVLFYGLGFRQKEKFPNKTFSNETLMLIGVFATAAAVGFLGKTIDKNSTHYSLLFLLSVGIYGFLAVKLRSQLIWIFMLISLGVWFGTETAYRSNWGFKFWGMNFPLRFTLFGLCVTAFAYLLQGRWMALKAFVGLSQLIGLLYLMLSLWMLSIFGNYSDFEDWTAVRQYHILYWGIAAILICLGCVWYGLKNKDYKMREIGFVFLILNIYTRYVEYLWDNINRAVFFLILALSFWFVGRWAEKIWHKKKTETLS